MSTKSETDQDFLFRFGLIGGKTTVVEAKNYLERIEASHKGQLTKQNKQLLEWAKQMARYQEILEDICSAEIKEGQKDKRPLAQIIEETYPHWKEYKRIKADTIAELNKIEEVKTICGLPEKAKYTVKVVQFCETLLNHLYTPLYSFDEFYKGQKEKTTKAILKYSELLMERKKIERRPEGHIPEGGQLQVVKTYLANIWHEGYETYEELIQDVELKARLKSFKVRIAKFNDNYNDKIWSSIGRDNKQLEETDKQISELKAILSKYEEQNKTLKGTIEKLETQLNITAEEIKSLKARIDSEEQDKKIIISSLSHSTQEANNFFQTKSILENQRDELSQEITRLREITENLSKEIQQWKIIDSKKTGELETLKKENSSLKHLRLSAEKPPFPKQKNGINPEKTQEMEKEINDQREMIKQLQREKSDVEEKIMDLEKKLQSYNTNMNLWKQQYKEQAKKQMSKVLSESRVNRQVEKEKYLKELRGYKSNCELAVQRIQQMSETIERKNSQIEQLNNSLSQSENKSSEVSLSIRSLQEENKVIDNQLQQISVLKTNLASEAKQIQENGRKIQELTEKLQKRDQEFDSLSLSEKQAKSELQKRSKLLQERSSEIESLKAVLRKSKEKIKELSLSDKQNALKIALLTEKLENSEMENSHLSESMQSKLLQKEKLLMERINEIEQLKTTLRKFEEKINESYLSDKKEKDNWLQELSAVKIELASEVKLNQEKSLKIALLTEKLENSEMVRSHLSQQMQSQLRQKEKLFQERNREIEQLNRSLIESKSKLSSALLSVTKLQEEAKDKDELLQKISDLESKLQSECNQNQEHLLKLSKLSEDLMKKDCEIEDNSNKSNEEIQTLKSSFENLTLRHNEALLKMESVQKQEVSQVGMMGARRYYLFNNDIFQAKLEEKQKLIDLLQAYTKKHLVQSKLLYKYDALNSTNLHKYIDGKSGLLCVAKTSRVIIAGFYPGALIPRTILNQGGLLVSVTNNKSYTLFNKPNETRSIRGMSYDDYNIIFGNSDVRIKIGNQREIRCNFNLNSSFFDSRGDTINDWLMEGGNNYTNFELCEYYQLTFGTEKE